MYKQEYKEYTSSLCLELLMAVHGSMMEHLYCFQTFFLYLQKLYLLLEDNNCSQLTSLCFGTGNSIFCIAVPSSARLGLKSTQSLSSTSSPVTGLVNLGTLSNPTAEVYESTERYPVPECVK